MVRKQGKRPLLAAAAMAGVALGGTLAILPQVQREEVPAAPAGQREYYQAQAEEKDYTVLLYLNGSDLEDGGEATANLGQILAAEIDWDSVHLVVETGGREDWEAQWIPPAGNTRFAIDEQGARLLGELESRNMGEAETLADFIRFGRESFPGRQTVLVLWNHGDGAVGGYGRDIRFGGDSLLLPELREALEAAGCGEEPLALVGFDACCMATVETAAALAPFARLLVASQEVEPGGGWDYRWLEQLLPGTEPEAVASAIAESYLDKYYYTPFPITASVVDLSRIGGVEDALEALFVKVSTEDFPIISRSRMEVLCYGGVGRGNGLSDLADLGSFAQALSTSHPQESTRLLGALNEAVLYSGNNDDFGEVPVGSGLTIYAPYHERESMADSVNIYEDIGFAPYYTAFVRQYAYWLPDQPEGPGAGEVKFTGQGSFTAPLEPGVAEYAAAYFTLWQPEEQAPYYSLVGSRPAELSGEAVRYADDLQWLYLKGEPVCALAAAGGMAEPVRLCPVLYNGRPANMAVREGCALYAVPVEERFAKELLEPRPGDTITPLYPVFPFGEEGEDIPPYQGGYGEYREGREIRVESLPLQLETEAIPRREGLLGGFLLVDFYGNYAYSEFRELENEKIAA